MDRFICRIQRVFAAGFLLSRPVSWKREEGQTFVEYAVLLGVLVVAMAAALTFVRSQMIALYQHISDEFDAALH